ncbi:hypothetical protein EVAR_81124_1 [Eumeta japonica]|uniref:Uncharacterized protein n=1 Tax=Eumeta variegata TaxID=151549 RepID=A0A4C1YVA5_EUMVA|nr:hypothetical protein EVAR_81124_1 [Eumeta japonica]
MWAIGKSPSPMDTHNSMEVTRSFPPFKEYALENSLVKHSSRSKRSRSDSGLKLRQACVEIKPMSLRLQAHALACVEQLGDAGGAGRGGHVTLPLPVRVAPRTSPGIIPHPSIIPIDGSHKERLCKIKNYIGS